MLVYINLEKLEQLGLTPNQYCLAHAIHLKDKKQFKLLQNLYKKDLYFKEDIYTLVAKEFLIQKEKDPHKIVFSESTIKGIDFDNPKEEKLEKVFLFGESEEVDDDDDWMIFVKEFRSIFPEGVTTGGKYVRSSTKDCSKKLKKFMKDYSGFNEELILEVTSNYVARYRLQSYKFMKTAEYFILKDGTSVLGSECEIHVEKGGKISSPGGTLLDGI